jgi:hypothetical protein
MKKITRFIAPIVLAAAVLLPSAAFATDRDYYVPFGTVALKLNQETPLNSWASLSPQTVNVARDANSLTDVWIDTFIGPIKLRYEPKTMTAITVMLPLVGSTWILNKDIAPLYWSPSNSKTGLALSGPQDVNILAIELNSGVYYAKINTWVGDLWVDVKDLFPKH